MFNQLISISKPFYTDSLFVLSISIVYVFFSIIIFYHSIKVILKPDKFNTFFAVSYPLLLFFIILVDYNINLLPFMPDTIMFSDIVSSGIVPESQSISIKYGFPIISWLPRMLSFGQPFLYLILIMPFSLIGGVLYYKAWTLCTYKNEINTQRFFLIILMFYPSMLIYSTSIVRDGLFIFGFGLFLVGLFKENKINVELVFGIIVLSLLRRQFMILLPILIFAYNITSMRRHSLMMKITFAIMFIFLCIFLFALINWLNYGVNLTSLSYLRNRPDIDFIGEYAYPPVVWDSYFDVLKDIPLFVLQFMLAPFPILVHVDFLSKYFALFDGIYVVVIYILSFSWERLKSHRQWFTIFFTCIIIFGTFEFFMIAAIRHRFPFILMLLPFAAETLSNKIKISTR